MATTVTSAYVVHAAKEARQYLIDKGICAVDGSGEPKVEGALSLLMRLAAGRVDIQHS